MAKSRSLDDILRDWPFQPGVISARTVRAKGGREVLQMRVELGVLQMEMTGRPDGERPEGYDTYIDYLVQQALKADHKFELTEEQCIEIDREFNQFYHRRICWLALREFERAVQDADHTLRLMDFARDYAADAEWLLSHEQYRPFVLFHRTQAASLAQLEAAGAEAAIEEINRGLGRIKDVFDSVQGEEQFEQDEMVRQLRQLQDWLREYYEVGRTLSEQLTDAIDSEQYELAARLRDEIAKRARRTPPTGDLR